MPFFTIGMKKAQNLVKEFTLKRGWEKQMPDHVAKSISIEAAELLELFQWSNPKVEDIKNNKEKLAELSGELADVLIYSLQMALLLGLDADEIVETKLTLDCRPCGVHGHKACPEGHFKCAFSIETSELLKKLSPTHP